MKHIFYVIKLLVLLILVSSCRKRLAQIDPNSTTLFVVNAVASDNSDIRPNMVEPRPWIADLRLLSYYEHDGDKETGTGIFGLPADKTVNFELFFANDTIKPFYREAFDGKPGDIYSLYIAGTRSDYVTLLMKDTMPVISDSVMAVRFINLSPNVGPISVNVKNNAEGSEIGELPFKSRSAFKQYPADKAHPIHEFEIRNAETGDLLKTFNLRSNPHQYKTLAIRGLAGGDWPELKVTAIQ